MNSGLWLPRHLKKAHKPVSIVFWYSQKIDRIVLGLPEQYPIPPILQAQGFNKVVCQSSREVEIWSQKMRDQERRDEEMDDEQREAIEGPQRAMLRKELVHLRDNARNQFNRDFCQMALDKIDAEEKRHKLKRISYQHVEAYEDGK